MNFKNLILETQLAFSLLTAIPMPGFKAEDRGFDLASCVWAFPLVGIVLGFLTGAIYYLCSVLGLSAFLSALICISAMVLITGALHEDGLADVADGFGGGQERSHVLDIMSDSSLGTYGTLALILTLGGRVGAVSQIGKPEIVIMALVSAACLSRTSCLFIIAGLPPARNIGLGYSIKNPGNSKIITASILCLGCILLLLDFKFVPLIVGTAMIVTLIMWRLARNIIGGFTGDVIGASLLLTELSVLLVLAVLFNR